VSCQLIGKSSFLEALRRFRTGISRGDHAFVTDSSRFYPSVAVPSAIPGCCKACSRSQRSCFGALKEENIRISFVTRPGRHFAVRVWRYLPLVFSCHSQPSSASCFGPLTIVYLLKLSIVRALEYFCIFYLLPVRHLMAVSSRQSAICWLCLPARPSLLAASALQIRHVLASRLLFNWLVVNGYFVAHFGGHSVRCFCPASPPRFGCVLSHN
jgi:hypothetical protein